MTKNDKQWTHMSGPILIYRSRLSNKPLLMDDWWSEWSLLYQSTVKTWICHQVSGSRSQSKSSCDQRDSRIGPEAGFSCLTSQMDPTVRPWSGNILICWPEHFCWNTVWNSNMPSNYNFPLKNVANMLQCQILHPTTIMLQYPNK